jgi:hypothetical protein
MVGLYLLGPTFAYSQAEKGDQEILVNGNFFARGGDYDFVMISGLFNYGFFVSDSLQIGGGPNITYTKVGGEGSKGDVTISLNVFIRQYFLQKGSKTVFYVGGEGYLYDAFGSKEESGTIGDKLYLKPLVGFKYYFAKKAAFDMNVGYGFGLKKGMGGMFSGTFGVSIII